MSSTGLRFPNHPHDERLSHFHRGFTAQRCSEMPKMLPPPRMLGMLGHHGRRRIELSNGLPTDTNYGCEFSAMMLDKILHKMLGMLGMLERVGHLHHESFIFRIVGTNEPTFGRNSTGNPRDDARQDAQRCWRRSDIPVISSAHLCLSNTSSQT